MALKYFPVKGDSDDIFDPMLGDIFINKELDTMAIFFNKAEKTECPVRKLTVGDDKVICFLM